MRRKIYPVDVSEVDDSGVNDILASVNADLKKVTDDAELFVKDMSQPVGGGKSAANQRPSDNARARPNESIPQSVINSNDMSHSPSTASVHRFDSAEEIKLTHEIVNSNNQMYKDLQARIRFLEAENEEIRKLNVQKGERLKKNDRQIKELETTMNEMEDDALKLKQQILTQGNALTPVQPNNNNQVIGPGGKGLSPAEQEMLKKHEQFRKALLFEHDEEEENKELNDLSLRKLFRSADIYSTLKKYILLYCIPLHNDILTVQARFGTAVASYFILYQFM